MSQLKVSIIVPIFKAEDTIRRSLDSILAQTFSDFEVLLIDDGSPDNCGKICDEYALKDSRFKVVHKRNEGVSAARQTGIDNAIGEYTIHVDPDDWIEPNMLNDLYAKAKEDDSDMVICDFYEDIGEKQIYHIQQPKQLSPAEIIVELFQELHGSCWNKLIRRVSYNQYGVTFPENVYYCEDRYVICSLLLHDIKVSYYGHAYYHYVQYSNKSTMTKYYDKNTYLHDINLKNKFLEIIPKEHIAYSIAEADLINNTLSRAYYYGYNFYTSKAYKNYFSIYSDFVLSYPYCRNRYFIYLACLGFYKPIRKFHFALTSIRGFCNTIFQIVR